MIIHGNRRFLYFWRKIRYADRCGRQLGRLTEPEIYHTAERVGKLIAGRGDVLFTGGSTGVMEAAMRGAKQAGGLTVGLIPAESKSAYAHLGAYIDIHIMTGLGELGKMAPLIHSVDGVIAIAGGAGTLIEMAMAYISKKPVILVPAVGHTTAAITHMLADGYLDYRRIQPIHTAADADSAVQLLYSQLNRSQK